MKSGAFVGRAAAAVAIFADGVDAHARLDALLEAARGAAFAIVRRDVALAVARVTREHFFVLHGALEEAFARLARERAVVEATDFVAADGTCSGKAAGAD